MSDLHDRWRRRHPLVLRAERRRRYTFNGEEVLGLLGIAAMLLIVVATVVRCAQVMLYLG